MPRPDQEAVLKALADFIELGRNVGLPKVVLPLDQFLSEFQTTKPTLKALQGPVHNAFSTAFIAIRDCVYDMVKFQEISGNFRDGNFRDGNFRDSPLNS